MHLGRPSLDGGEQRVVREVGIPHGRLVIGVTQDLADREQVDPGIDHEGADRRAQPQLAQFPKGV